MDWSAIWTGVSLGAVIMQGVLVWIWFRLRRDVRETLAEANVRNRESQRWLAQAKALLAHNTALLREHGFLVASPEEPDETIQ